MDRRAIARTKDWIIRRTILSLLLCLLFLFPGPAAAQLLPIIDLHFHFNEEWDIDAFVKEMDALGVAKAGNAPFFFARIRSRWIGRGGTPTGSFRLPASRQSVASANPTGSELGHFRPRLWSPTFSSSRLR